MYTIFVFKQYLLVIIPSELLSTSSDIINYIMLFVVRFYVTEFSILKTNKKLYGNFYTYIDHSNFLFLELSY